MAQPDNRLQETPLRAAAELARSLAVIRVCVRRFAEISSARPGG